MNLFEDGGHYGPVWGRRTVWTNMGMEGGHYVGKDVTIYDNVRKEDTMNPFGEGGPCGPKGRRRTQWITLEQDNHDISACASLATVVCILVRHWYNY